ncbi:MAG TPA: NADH-quinone oxidoreductase subunit N [Bacteriovoracaceae bacterium]|nr:NADH-quinone oxidoreductase subunit N [Bacteriovoracaceae bacterium]
MRILEVFPAIALDESELYSLLPLILLSFGAVACLLAGCDKTRGRTWAFAISLGTLFFSIILGAYALLNPEIKLLGETLVFTSVTKTVSLMVMSFSFLAVILTYGQDKKEGLLSEIYALILFSTAGMILMMCTSHLLFMFIALEIMSLAIYVMVAMRRSSSFSAEAGLKYFILGGLASALLLYGTSLIFGATGSFQLENISEFLRSHPNPSFIFYIGLGLVITAMLFKVGAVPFHGWVPDVYQGAATNVTGFMGAAVKFTAFMAFSRIVQHLVFVEGVQGLKWFENYIWLVAAASMIYGNFVAISQTEIKRMLAFSTIAHTGYLLLGLYAMNLGDQSAGSVILYLFFYALSNLGAFAVISQFEEKNQKDLTLDQMAGLGLRHPVLGACLTLFLLSMAGIPLTSGFIGKYGLFNSVVNAGEVPLVVIAVLTSVVSVYYYLRVIVYMFMKESTAETASYQALRGAGVAAFISAAATLQFGLFPRAIIHFVKLISK